MLQIALGLILKDLLSEILGGKLGQNLWTLLGIELGETLGSTLGPEIGAALLLETLGNVLGKRFGLRLGMEVGTALGCKINFKLGKELGAPLWIFNRYCHCSNWCIPLLPHRCCCRRCCRCCLCQHHWGISCMFIGIVFNTVVYNCFTRSGWRINRWLDSICRCANLVLVHIGGYYYHCVWTSSIRWRCWCIIGTLFKEKTFAIVQT